MNLLAKRERREPYDAGWRLDIRTTKKVVRVYVTKRAIPLVIRQGQKDQPETSSMLIGEVNGDDADLDAKLDALVETAQNRATTLSLTQNSHNEYDQRIASAYARRHWKWFLGAGVVIGMALPNIPFIPIL